MNDAEVIKYLQDQSQNHEYFIGIFSRGGATANRMVNGKYYIGGGETISEAIADCESKISKLEDSP
jgi:hypothetical protein